MSEKSLQKLINNRKAHTLEDRGQKAILVFLFVEHWRVNPSFGEQATYIPTF
jgi:hypothetical protein